jgi:hypothetical protein
MASSINTFVPVASSASPASISLTSTLLRYQQQALKRLLSERGKGLRARYGAEVEHVFGRIKQDWGFGRFNLKGMEMVKIEWGWLCIARNIVKLAVIELDRQFFCFFSTIVNFNQKEAVLFFSFAASKASFPASSCACFVPPWPWG